MRTAFLESLYQKAEQDDRIWLLTNDLGYSVLERFASRFPDRFINMGVAEQNMTGAAAGLALCGKIVFTYSIANFPIMRCLEQIRNDVCYHNLNVKIISVGGGLAYGPAGYTHHGVEDLAVMRAMPNMTVIAPGDPIETQLATNAIVDWPGPCYLRLGKSGEPMVHQNQPDFQIGKAIHLKHGKDVTLISTGGMLRSVLLASEKLSKQSVSVQVLSMPTLCPLDDTAILQASRTTNKIVTVEEHGPCGLGSAVSEVLAREGKPVDLTTLRLKPGAVASAGSQDQLRSDQGLTVDEIVKAASIQR